MEKPKPKILHKAKPIVNTPEQLALKQRLTVLATNQPQFLPMQDTTFNQCSKAVSKAATAGGRKLVLPSVMLPPV